MQTLRPNLSISKYEYFVDPLHTPANVHAPTLMFSLAMAQVGFVSRLFSTFRKSKAQAHIK